MDLQGRGGRHRRDDSKGEGRRVNQIRPLPHQQPGAGYVSLSLKEMFLGKHTLSLLLKTTMPLEDLSSSGCSGRKESVKTGCQCTSSAR